MEKVVTILDTYESISLAASAQVQLRMTANRLKRRTSNPEKKHMKYHIDYQHLPNGAGRPIDDGEIVGIDATDESGSSSSQYFNAAYSWLR